MTLVSTTIEAASAPRSAMHGAMHASRPERRQITTFVVVNTLVASGALLSLAIHPRTQIGLASYVMLLGLTCSAPLLCVKSLQGRSALLLAFQGIFFSLFGLADWAMLMFGTPFERPPGGFLTPGEIAILLTSVCFTLGYLAVLAVAPREVRGWMARDWSPRAIAIMGVFFWACGFALTAMFMSGINVLRGTTTGFAVFGDLAGVAVLFSYLMPMGDMCLIYLFLTRRSRLALGLLAVMFACEFAMGFLASSKELAFRGMVLFVISIPFLRGRAPLKSVFVYALIAGLTFSFFEDMRAHVARYGADFGANFERLSDDATRTFGRNNTVAGRFERGAKYFATRGNLKGNVELIVAHTGVDVPYQEGYTIGILKYAFLPRFILPDKPKSSIGQMFNREFHISDVRTVYIAPSQNGELYWNYGWAGIVAGMLIIGALMAGTSVMLDLRQHITLPRFLCLMLTVYLVAFRFEANIAQQYTLWLRAAALLFVIHLFMPKAR